MLTGFLSGFILIPQPIIYSLKEKVALFKGPHMEQLCSSACLPALSCLLPLFSGASRQSPEMGGWQVGSDELCGGLRWRPGWWDSVTPLSRPSHSLFFFAGILRKVSLKKSKTKQNEMLTNARKHLPVHLEAELRVDVEPCRVVLALGHESCQ